MIKKRYMYLTEEILKIYAPTWHHRWMPGKTCRWLRSQSSAKKPPLEPLKNGVNPSPRSPTSSFAPSVASICLAPTTGSRPSVKRLMMYQQGCFAGGTVLRVAKDLAENNKGARVLVVCSEITTVT
ncbi:hypothetical protein GQ457_07G016330 [Hibiscus cannabinus]